MAWTSSMHSKAWWLFVFLNSRNLAPRCRWLVVSSGRHETNVSQATAVLESTRERNSEVTITSAKWFDDEKRYWKIIQYRNFWTRCRRIGFSEILWPKGTHQSVGESPQLLKSILIFKLKAQRDHWMAHSYGRALGFISTFIASPCGYMEKVQNREPDETCYLTGVLRIPSLSASSSQTSPIPSLSASSCPEFGILKQLSWNETNEQW